MCMILSILYLIILKHLQIVSLILKHLQIGILKNYTSENGKCVSKVKNTVKNVISIILSLQNEVTGK